MSDQPYYYQGGGEKNQTPGSTDKGYAQPYPPQQQPSYGYQQSPPYGGSSQQGNYQQGGYQQQGYPQQGYPQQGQPGYPQHQGSYPGPQYGGQPAPVVYQQAPPKKDDRSGLCAAFGLGACLCCCLDCLT
ncbi:hypothetical protein DFS34DRAFT_433696 [Phlyctochytrium arcticum]|nr:hypothetical protein DFS34DRAFT_433696 [Phlyctochytrium arcticum]